MSAAPPERVEPSPPLPPMSAVMARAAGENFPVASRLLARGDREHLLAIYGFARLVDELGDTFPGDRLAALDWLEGELQEAYAGSAKHPLLVALAVTLRERRLALGPFQRLIEANRADQRVKRYETFEQLRGYCHLSADPVGELVLGVFGLATPERIELSDSICTALQLTEHWQDVAEDMRAGRIYIPTEDLERFAVSEQDLAAPRASDEVRALLAFEVARARLELDRGARLLGTLSARARLAVAAFVGGGSAALDSIERARFDVLARSPAAGRPRRALKTLAALMQRPR